MVEFKAFLGLKNFFSRLNPVSSFGLGEIKVDVEKTLTFVKLPRLVEAVDF